MSEDEDYEDLPSITVLSSVRDFSLFGMPSAGEVATQREREAQCERALSRLRAAAPAHSDSSGSEGEAYLAAAVTALQMQAADGAQPAEDGASGGPGAGPRRPGAALAAALASSRPQDALLAAALAAHTLQPPHEHTLLFHMTTQVCAAIACSSNTWSTEEALSAAAYLCCVLEGTGRGSGRARGRGRAGVRRALQRLLDHAAPAAAAPLARLLAQAGGEGGGGGGGARLLRLADGLRSGAGGGADRAAGELARAALAGGGARYACVQAAGRLLAAGGGEGGGEGERGEQLAHVERATAGLSRHRPDHLKVLVAASKLRLLFQAAQ